MNQSRNILKAVILIGLTFLEASSGTLHLRHLEEKCQELTINGISTNDYDSYNFSVNTRCLLEGGKYCTANTIHSPNITGSFQLVGQGCCRDWSAGFYDYSYYVGPLTVEGCESQCIAAMAEIGSPLRGFSRGSAKEESDCYCYFDDAAITNVPVAATSVGHDFSGKGEIKDSTMLCLLPLGQCYRYLSRECPSSITPTSEDSLILVGDGCCRSFEDDFYDFVYFTDLLSVEECESKCISVMEEIGSPLRGFNRRSSTENSTCMCYFDDEVITSVPACGSGAWTDGSGMGEIKDASMLCLFPFGQCYRYDSTKQTLADTISSDPSSKDFVTACLTLECDTTYEFILDGITMDANKTLQDVKCMASTCSSFEAGVNYQGNDIGSVSATDPTHCCDACQKAVGCKLFSWSQPGNICYLKSVKGDPLSDVSYISGNII
jgi:hypothetical protein